MLKVSAVPFLERKDFNTDKFFEDMLTDETFVNTKDKTNAARMLMTKACKSAIKAGDKLNNSEIEYLIDNIIKNGTKLYCPHGRPIAVIVTKKEIEKWFKRIV